VTGVQTCALPIYVGDYYLFQPIEITDKRISIHERSTPVPFKHSSIQYPLPGEVTEDYLGVRLGEGPVLAPVPAAAFAVPNKKMADRVNKLVATVTAAQEGRVERSELEEMDEVYNGEAAVFEPEEAEPVNEIEDLVNTLTNTFETCLTVYEKPTKEQDEWYYYCGKVIDQISQTEEFQITKEELHELIIANLLEHLLFNDSLTLVNYLYEKNNYSMIVSDGGGGSSSSGGVAMVQPLMPFERMLLNYYRNQLIIRPLVGRRAAAAAAASNGGTAATGAPQDLGLLLFHEKKDPPYALVVLPYESREWRLAEPEDERDYELLLGKLQTNHIQNMNMVIGFISFFQKEYLIFKVKVMSKKRDKGARCDQSGKTETITTINTLLSLNAATSGDEYKLTIENTKFRTQRELCVFQEFLLRTFHRNRVNGRKWFFTPCEAILCNIEKLYMEK